MRFLAKSPGANGLKQNWIRGLHYGKWLTNIMGWILAFHRAWATPKGRLILLAVISASHKSALSRIARLEFSDAFILTWRLAFATLHWRSGKKELVGRFYSRVEWTSAFKGFLHFENLTFLFECSASREAKRPPPLKISGKETRSRSLARSI